MLLCRIQAVDVFRNTKQYDVVHGFEFTIRISAHVEKRQIDCPFGEGVFFASIIFVWWVWHTRVRGVGEGRYKSISLLPKIETDVVEQSTWVLCFDLVEPDPRAKVYA